MSDNNEFKVWRDGLFDDPRYLGSDIAQIAWDVQQEKIDHLTEKLKVCEAESREIKRMNREERLILEAKLCELEKIAREGLDKYCICKDTSLIHCVACIDLKKIDKLMEKNENNNTRLP